MNDTPHAPAATPEPRAAEARGLRGLLRRHGPLIRHWALFTLILGAFVAVSEWASYWTNHRFSEVTAQWLALSLRLMGETPVVSGIKISCATCSFRIIGECTAYYPCTIFVSAVLAFPAAWTRKLLGVVLGVPAVLLVNQVRLVSLCYIADAFPEQFETIHIVVWQSLIIFLTVLLWIVWVITLAQRR
jgi:archaeosortase B (VPXXXP-CTERM-specific)